MSHSISPGIRWLHYAASIWSVLFAAPHVWWALGVPAGFPGGQANHELMFTTWRYYGDVTVILLCALALGVAIAPLQHWGSSIPRKLLRAMAYTASAMLGLRGLAGMIVNGMKDPIWWPTFLAGGILFGAIAYVHPSEKTA